LYGESPYSVSISIAPKQDAADVLGRLKSQTAPYGHGSVSVLCRFFGFHPTGRESPTRKSLDEDGGREVPSRLKSQTAPYGHGSVSVVCRFFGFHPTGRESRARKPLDGNLKPLPMVTARFRCSVDFSGSMSPVGITCSAAQD
jgi:hypothetical protein